jgi:hypothetical protein
MLDMNTPVPAKMLIMQFLEICILYFAGFYHTFFII